MILTTEGYLLRPRDDLHYYDSRSIVLAVHLTALEAWRIGTTT